MAQQLLDRADPKTAGLWPRAAALLARQALEAALDEFWHSKKLTFEAKSGRRQQLICLREYLGAEAGGVHHAWQALSRACHHHPYELVPTAGEIRQWMDGIGKITAGETA